LIKCINELSDDLSIFNLIELNYNLFYLNIENEQTAIPTSVVIAFRQLYLKLKEELCTLILKSSNNEEVDLRLLNLLGSTYFAKLTSCISNDRVQCLFSNDSCLGKNLNSSISAKSERLEAALNQISNKEKQSDKKLILHELEFEFVDAVSISPRLPLTKGVSTQTNDFNIDKMDAFVQAAVSSMNQATATSPESVQNFPLISTQNENGSSNDKSLTTSMLTPSSTSIINQSTELSSNGQLDESKVISLLSRHKNHVMIYNVSPDGGIVAKQPRTFNCSSILSENPSTDDYEIESISLNNL
jgi:hypothetical protein